MPSETRTCQSCKTTFAIAAEDFDFYKKISVPPPTWCPECRMRRRYAWRNDRNLYRRECGLCKKSIVTMYSPNKPFAVYCPNCWWGDGWDAAAYGRELDFSRPFFEQFAELQCDVPRIALLGKNSVNSEYTNHSSDNKNCFMCSSAMHCEDAMYSDFVLHSSSIADCALAYEKAERCYECVDVRTSYRCQYSMLIQDCSECYYCYDCRGGTDCFLSANLRNKKYCFLNEQLDKEAYQAKVKEWNLGSHGDREKLYAQYQELLSKRALRKYAAIERSVASTGSYVFNSKNAIQCFDADGLEDAKHCVNVSDGKTVMDSYRNADKIELVYECHALIRDYNVAFCNLSYDDSDLQYCDHCFNSHDLFGCIGMKKGEYSILNKRYSPEEYEALRAKVIEHMRAGGEYGEFFPVALSPFGYNESHAQLYMPLSKDEVLARGWKWEDQSLGTFGKETLQPEAIPDKIEDAKDDILQAALKCASCSRNYNIIRPELDFYRRENVPVPRLCPACRDRRRIALRPPRRLWQRQCMCDYAARPNTVKHAHHLEGQCPNEFETPYAPGRPEAVYCEPCYNAEIL